MLTSLQTRSSIRVESILTSLVFDHALRLRVKADTSDSKAAPDQSSAISGNTQNKHVEDGPRGSKGGNIVGRIMNMATSDLNNITGGRNFPLLRMLRDCKAILIIALTPNDSHWCTR